MEDIVAALPRVLTEIVRIEAAVRTLSADLLQLTGALEDINQGTNARVDVLARLDMTKSNMRSSLVTLKEVANWASLVRDVEAKFADSDLMGVTEGWEGLIRSLSVLKHMPEADERAETIASVRSRLETALRPQLHAALQQQQSSTVSGSSHSSLSNLAGASSSSSARMFPTGTAAQQTPPQASAALLQCFDMYKRLGDTAALKEEYTKARCATLHKLWYAHSRCVRIKAQITDAYNSIGTKGVENMRCVYE